MKTKELIIKVGLDKGFTKSKGEKLVKLLGEDFRERLVRYNIDGSEYKKFQNVVNEIKSKWDSISNKVPYGLSDGLWSYFYTSQICEIRDEMFPQFKKDKR